MLKNRDITFSTKVHLFKAMVFPVVTYGCESWTIKKAEHQRIDDELYSQKVKTKAKHQAIGCADVNSPKTGLLYPRTGHSDTLVATCSSLQSLTLVFFPLMILPQSRSSPKLLFYLFILFLKVEVSDQSLSRVRLFATP